MLADVGEEELEGVRGTAQRLGGPHGRLLRFALALLLVGRLHRRTDLEPHRLELALDLLELVVRELVLGLEHLELRGVHPAALLGALDQGAELVRLEQFDELVLRQAGVSPFDSVGGARSLRTLRGIPRDSRGRCGKRRVTSPQRAAGVSYSVEASDPGAPGAAAIRPGEPVDGGP